MSSPRRNAPAAIFLTFTCYGTWLHGDERGSVDHKDNAVGNPTVVPNRSFEGRERFLRVQDPVRLTLSMREQVTTAIYEVCEVRAWHLSAVNVRSNHVHVVVTADAPPERVLTTLKAYATRQLIDAGLIERGRHVWTRHGSTRYVWDPEDVPKVMDYVINGQDGERFESEPRQRKSEPRTSVSGAMPGIEPSPALAIAPSP